MPKRYIVQDTYFKQAKQDGYRARSAYKLQEIDEKFAIFKNAKSILDLGCCPGSWLQYAVKKSPAATIAGIDLTPTEVIENVHIVTGDATDEPTMQSLCNEVGVKTFDVIMSDMAPKTKGIFDVDQYASVELNLLALECMKTYLSPKGVGIFKIFRGEDFNDFWFEAKEFFPNIKTFKPKACRDRSFEIYVIGKR